MTFISVDGTTERPIFILVVKSRGFSHIFGCKVGTSIGAISTLVKAGLGDAAARAKFRRFQRKLEKIS